jgi:hypothetical protein
MVGKSKQLMWIWLSPLLFGLAALSSLSGQEAVIGFFPDAVGNWDQKISLDYADDYGISSADRKALGGKLDALAAILRDSKVFNPPRGFMARLRARFLPPSICPQTACPGWPAAADAAMMIYFFVGRNANGEYDWGGEANTSARFGLNDLGDTLSYRFELYQLPNGANIYYSPRKTADIAGFPLFENTVLVVAKEPRPYWVPVSREEYLKAAISFYQAELAKHRKQLAAIPDSPYQDWLKGKEERRKSREQAYAAIKKMDAAKADEYLKKAEEMEAAMEAKLKPLPPEGARLKADDDSVDRQAIDALQRELAAMTPAERRSQAWRGRIDEKKIGANFFSQLVPAGSAEAGPLVTLNPEFFDKSKPRSAVQLITIHMYWEGYSASHIGVIRLNEMLATTNWAKIAALLD